MTCSSRKNYYTCRIRLTVHNNSKACKSNAKIVKHYTSLFSGLASHSTIPHTKEGSLSVFILWFKTICQSWVIYDFGAELYLLFKKFAFYPTCIALDRWTRSLSWLNLKVATHHTHRDLTYGVIITKRTNWETYA